MGQEAAVQETILKKLPADVRAANEIYEVRSISSTAAGEAVECGYRLLTPETVEPGRQYPLVVFLHGAGERGSDNVMQLKYLPAWMAEPALRRKHPCFLIAAQCRMDERWVDVSWADKQSTPQAAEPTTDLKAVAAMIDDVMQREPVDPGRVFLTGLSMGGFGAWDLAARMPERFAAVLPICGGGDERTAARIAKLPIWARHGDADKAVPVERSRSMIAAVEAAGGSPRYTEMAGVGHDAWTPTYRDAAVLDWLFSQQK